MECVHEKQVKIGGRLRKVRYYHKEDKRQYHARERKDSHELPECISPVFALPVIIEEDEARNRQQVQQVNAYRKSHQEADQHNPAVRVGFVRLFVPLRHRPEHERREERGHRIDLTLDRREPKCVREAVCECSDCSASVNRERLAYGISPVFVGSYNASREKNYREVEEKYRQRRAYRAHRVHCDGRVHLVRKHRAEPRNELKHRVSRRMSDFELI